MVLYKRKPIALPDPEVLPGNLNINVWHIDETGEWFASYKEYLDRLDFYSRHHFTCEITGTSCLTFFEALDSEERQFRLVEEKFPLKLREPVARFLHFNEVKRLDALVEKVYARFKNDFFPGETVYLRKGNREVSAPSSNQATPQPDEGVFKSANKENGSEPFQPQYQKPYVIKEKAQFNATTNPLTGEIVVPAYSKYMLIEECQGNMSLIADQSQLYRDRSTFTKHLIKCFCKITLRRASSKMGAPWAVKGEYLVMYGLTMDWPPEMLIYKEDEDRSRRSKTNDQLNDDFGPEKESVEEEEEIDGEGEDSASASKRRKAAEDTKEDSAAQETVPWNGVTSILDDLSLPYQGSPHIYEGLYHYNENLERIRLDCSLNAKPFNSMGRLLQVFQFLNSFGPSILLSQFNLDQFITTIKCSDPLELRGEVVYVELAEDDSDAVDKEPSDWQRNTDIRMMIQDKNSPKIRYTIVKDDPANEETLNNINHNGTGLLVEIICALLRLFVNEEGEWSLSLSEDWLQSDTPELSHGSFNEELGDSDEEEESSEIDEQLEKCLNYRNASWAERLTKRQFNNEYWLIILLGVFQDCNHIPVYKGIIDEFNKKVIPDSILAMRLPKQLWHNFCCNLSLEEKVNVLWVLVDLATNYSPDIKSAVDSSMDLCTHIRSERFRVGRDLKTETVQYHQLRINLDALEGMEGADENILEQNRSFLAEQQIKVDSLQRDKLFLDKKLMENDIQRLKPLGVDRYGNKYFWLEMSGVQIDKFQEPNEDAAEYSTYHSGRLWIQGPTADTAKFLLKISDDSLTEWLALARTKGKTQATRDVFHIYKADDGSYLHIEGDTETVIVDSMGRFNVLIEPTPIQRKIIDETPECLMLSDREWYSVDRPTDVDHLLDWFDTWGRREHELIKQFKPVADDLKAAYRLREMVTNSDQLNQIERDLFSDLKENELDDLEPEAEGEAGDNDRQSDGGSPDQADSNDEDELESIAEEIMKLDDSSQTRKILNKVKELEDRRDVLLERRQALNRNSGPGFRVQARAERKRLENIRDAKLNRQAEILTDLLNHRHFRDMQDVIGWRNDLAVAAYGTSLRKNASGATKASILDTVDKKLKEIIYQTSRATATASAS